MAPEHTDTGGRGRPSTSFSGDGVDDEIAVKLAGLARDLERQDSPDAVLAGIVAAAVALVPGTDEGSISVITARTRVMSQAPTSDLPRLVDAVQEEVRQGPCLDAAYEHETVRIDDMTHEQRWPLFAARAAELGAGSMLALQLYVEGDDLGAINLFARTPESFTDESEEIGLLVAAHAAIAYVGARNGAHLAAALANRDLIGQAKGMVMERYHLKSDRAFLLLTRVSQNSNRKLLHVATELVETGAVSGPHGLPPRPR